jgi:hypothetical protein
VSSAHYSYIPGSDLLAGYAIFSGGSQSLATVSRAYDELDRLTSISATNNSATINSFVASSSLFFLHLDD